MPDVRIADPASDETAQIARLAGIVTAAVGHSDRAGNLHDLAARRIDAALYDLGNLRDELAAVIERPLPRCTDAGDLTIAGLKARLADAAPGIRPRSTGPEADQPVTDDRARATQSAA